MKLLIFAVSILSLAGCTTAELVAGPDGTAHQLISCNAVQECYAKASEVCGKYSIVNTSTNTAGSNGYTSSQINLLVKCTD